MTVEGDLVQSDRLVGVPGAPAPVRRSSKAAAGRLLDGRTWDEMPAKAGHLGRPETCPHRGSGTHGACGKPRCSLARTSPHSRRPASGLSTPTFIDCFAGEPDAVDWEGEPFHSSARLALMADPPLTHAVFFELEEIAGPLELPSGRLSRP